MTTSANEPLLILLVVLSTVLGAVLYVWTALALAGLFRKTGEEPWQAWVPALNIAVVLRLGRFSPWLVLVGLVPVAGWIALAVLVVVAAHRIGGDFDAGPGMTVLAALLFVVWASILGLGPARWRGQRPAAAPAPWVFSPPMSEPDASDGPAPAHRAPVAPPTIATPVLSPRHFRPEPTAGSGERSGTDGDAAQPAPAREQAPAGLQPSPWAPPSPFAPAGMVEDAPAAADAPAASTPPPPAPPAPTPTRATSPVPAPAPDAGPTPAAPVRQPAADSPAPAAPAPAAPAPAASAPAAPAGASATGADEEPDDARWPSEIDDVSALSPSPFPSRAASDRPGVVPSFADPDSAASPHAGRRTWDAVPATPIARRAFGAAPDEFPELSDEVSAVVGAPAAGAPRGAEAAVPAQLRRAEAADDAGEGEADHTVVVARRRAFWQLVLPDAAVVPLSGDVVIVGRQPAPDPAFPRAQLVAIEDRTRTVSKTHARLELRSGLWHITDLHSTNGVVLTNFLGTEIELEPGSDAPAGERFLLGDAELRIERPGT